MPEDANKSVARLEGFSDRLFSDWLHLEDHHARLPWSIVEEVDLRTCRKYLSKKLDDVDCLLEGELRKVTHSPAGTIAAQIEANLYSDKKVDRLDMLIMREVEYRCSLLETCIARRGNLARENTRKLFDEWDSMG
jgi:hypothetical protein